MINFRGIGFKIFVTVMAVIALGAGIYIYFFQMSGYSTTTGTIVSIEEDPNYIKDPNVENDAQYIVKVRYTVDGKTYTEELGFYDPGFAVGKEVKVYYDPKDPSKIHGGRGFGIYLMIAGGVILFLVIFFTIRDRRKLKKIQALQGKTVYLPSEKGENRELYFLSDLGTVRIGHRLEDKDRKVLYEAKMTKLTVGGAYEFDFIDHEKGTTTQHLVGRDEARERNSIIFDNYYTFKFDGEEIWDHLKRNGINVESKFASGKVAITEFRIFRDNELIATVQNSSKFVHEEDAEQHSVQSLVPVSGFYRIWTREKNMDLLFVTIMAFARSGAADSRGGSSRRTLVNTLNQ